MVVTLALGQSSGAQQENTGTSGKQDRGQKPSGTETIYGVVAGITAEGEVVFDYAQNRAVVAEAAFLTVVGSPMRSETGGAESRDKAATGDKDGKSANKRHNVYMVWLSPRTKIFQATGGSDRPGRAQTGGRTPDDRKEAGLDQLEVGDRVRIQLNYTEDSSPTSKIHQTERMRQKHGRDRVYVGEATEITILAPRDAGGSRPGSDGSRPRSQ